jgi:hypothetical protein
MSHKQWICPGWGWIYLVKQDFEQRKSRSDTKTMNLGPDELMNRNQDTLELVEINRATRFNIFVTPLVFTVAIAEQSTMLHLVIVGNQWLMNLV